jgi:hypothetical protein
MKWLMTEEGELINLDLVKSIERLDKKIIARHSSLRDPEDPDFNSICFFNGKTEIEAIKYFQKMIEMLEPYHIYIIKRPLNEKD